jgi:hypothetical protein
VSRGDRLESRYRRLLACYPWEHRRAYEDEMLGVLMASARPGQRTPGLGEAVNLVLSGLRTRLGSTVRSLGDRRWAQAATTVGLLGTIVLLVQRLHSVVGALTLSAVWPFDEPAPAYDPTRSWLSVLAWTAVLIGASTGLRRTAALLSWAVVIAQLTAVSTYPYFSYSPMLPVYTVWPLILGLVTAVALTVPAAGVVATRIVGGRGLLLIGVAGTLTTGAAVVGPLPIPGFGWSALGQLPVFGRLVALPALVLYLIAGLFGLAALARIPAPIRRRMMVILAPVAAVMAVTGWGGAGAPFLNGQLGDLRYVDPELLVALVVAPVLAFVVGVALLRRRERTLHLLAIGRRNDHPDWFGPASTDPPNQ